MASGFSRKQLQKHKTMENSFSNSNQSVKRRSGATFILAVVLGSCVVTGLRAQVVVVPNELAANDGNSSTTAPPEGSGAIHRMHIFDASQFSALSGPAFLTQIAFRPDTIPGPVGPRTATLRIYASTTSRTATGMSTTFSQNIGTNKTLVFDGTVPLSTEDLPGPGNTRQFDIVYPFTTPFLYDPAAGNLLLEAQASSGSGAALKWDAVTGEPSVGTIIAPGSPTAATGNFAETPVHQFTFEAPALATIRMSQTEICWNSKSNVTYQVEFRSNLTANIWTSLGDCIRSTNSTTCIYDPIVLGEPQKFYRVVLTNCVPQ
jgi:hypothetical protein